MGQAERIEWITDQARWQELAEPWRLLAGSDPRPFAGPDWFGPWWSAFGRGARLRACAAWRGTELAGVLPLHLRGGRLAAMANYHTPTFCWPARDRAARAALLAAAAATRAASVELHALARADPPAEEAIAVLAAAGRVLLAEPVHASPVVDTRGDRDAYMSERASRMRKLRRLRRKLEREHEASFVLDADPLDLEADLGRGFAVEASGWKSGRGTAIASAPETEAFYRALARAHHARGELRLGWLHVDGRAVAFSLCLQRARRLYLLKTGYDRAARRDAPGLLLNLDLVERCFAGGLDAFELLGAQEEWKQVLATGTREHVRLHAYRRRPLPLARYVARRHALPRLRRMRALAAARRAS